MKRIKFMVLFFMLTGAAFAWESQLTSYDGKSAGVREDVFFDRENHCLSIHFNFHQYYTMLAFRDKLNENGFVCKQDGNYMLHISPDNVLELKTMSFGDAMRLHNCWTHTYTHKEIMYELGELNRDPI